MRLLLNDKVNKYKTVEPKAEYFNDLSQRYRVLTRSFDQFLDAFMKKKRSSIRNQTIDKTRSKSVDILTKQSVNKKRKTTITA